MGFEVGIGQIALAGGKQERIGGAVEDAEVEVVVQVAGVVHGKAGMG